MARIPYAPSLGGFTSTNPTAFAQMSNIQGTGNLNSLNLWNDPDNNYYKFAFATEPLAKAQTFQNLARSLNQNPGPSGYNNQFEYIQSLLIKSGLSKSGLDMQSALSNVVAASVGLNTSPTSFLENYIAGIKPKVIKQPDTTTQYAKQIQTALQFKDLGDARQYYSDSYFSTWGEQPSADLDKKFQNAWNNEIRTQDQPTTTTTKTEKAPIYDKKSKPVIDKATGKQKIDRFGRLEYSSKAKDANGQYRYETVITGKSTSQGEGFSKEEQQQFLADFLVNNNPDTAWNVDNLGGAAKTLYDGIAAFHKSNYSKVPDLTTLQPLIKNVLSSADANAANEYLNQYKISARKQTASKYMSLAEYINAGEDADKYVKPMLEGISAMLEKNITIDDQFGVQIFNFKDDKGVYRMPNAYELNQLVINHPDYAKTSTAINNAVDMGQNLKTKLGRA
jgi:hypothetical protein